MKKNNYRIVGRPVGDVFDYHGHTLCVKMAEYSPLNCDVCKGCFFDGYTVECMTAAGTNSFCGPCNAEYREDDTNVIFEEQ